VNVVGLALRGDLTGARRALDAAQARHRLDLVDDCEPGLFVGTFAVRENATDRSSPHRIRELARSWERFDRVYVAADARERELGGIVRAFAADTGLVAGVGEVWLLLHGELVASWPDGRWELHAGAGDADASRLAVARLTLPAAR